VDEGGDVHVFRAGVTFDRLATNSLGEPCLATPAIAHDALYVRTTSHLFCLAKTK
jgi:outer membrane protein assembly factor BamB